MISPLLSNLRTLRSRFPQYGWALPVLVCLGVIGSLAESFGLTLVILLVGLLLGGTAVPADGLLGDIFRVAYDAVDGRTGILALLVFSLILVRTVAGMVYGLLSSNMRHGLSESVRASLYDIYLTAPYAFIHGRDIGALHETLSQHSWSVADALARLIRVAANVCSILVFTVFLVLVSVPAALVAAAGSVAIFWLAARLGRKASEMGERSAEANALMTSRMLIDLYGLRTIRAFGRERWAARRFRAVSRRARARFQEVDRLQTLIYPLTEIGYLLLLGLVAWISALAGVSNAATFTAVLLLYRLQPHLRELDSNRLALAGHAASLSLVMKMMAADERASGPDGHAKYRGLGSGIAFENVEFGYGTGRPVLCGASFVIPPRGLTVIHGPSGSGKSTIINLLLRLYDPDDGRISVGGVDLKTIRRADWLRHVALSGQDSDLFPATIASNLRLGRLNASLPELEAAAALAGIDETIQSLPGAYDTEIGRGGFGISGGQRQRIGLARALLRDPDLLILDEATNAVEHGLEASILNAIIEQRADKATILITHRQADLGFNAHVVDLARCQQNTAENETF